MWRDCVRGVWVMLVFAGWSAVAVAASPADPAAGWKQSLGQHLENRGDIRLFDISGSNTIGARLAPALVQAFLRAEGFDDVRVSPLGENEQVISAIWKGTARPVRVSVTVKAHGTRTGFAALQQGEADLAAASRPLTAAEVETLAVSGNLRAPGQEHVIAIDGLAIIVHPDNPLRQLTMTQIRQLFSGAVSNWRDVGGSQRQVRVYARDDKSGTYDTFASLVLRGTPLQAQTVRFESNALLAQSVAADPAGIGFVPLANIGQAVAVAVADDNVPGLRPDVLTVAAEDYLLSRRLYLYSLPDGQRSPALSAFLEFVLADAGQQVVEQNGFVAQAMHPVAVDPADARLLGWQRLNLNIRFADGASDLDNKALVDIERLTAYLNRSPIGAPQLTLVGYSNPAPAQGQAALSRLRAQSVRWALRQQGVRGDIETLAGDSVLVADPQSPQADRNRRVEVWVRRAADPQAVGKVADR